MAGEDGSVKNGSEAGSLPPALGTEQLVSAVTVARPHATVRYHASRDQPSRSIDNPTSTDLSLGLLRRHAAHPLPRCCHMLRGTKLQENQVAK